MQDPSFEQTVERLLRPERPAPADHVRILVIHGGSPPVVNADGAQTVGEQAAVSRNEFLDVKGAPIFDLIVGDNSGSPDVLDTTLRFLSVRRPPVFLVIGREHDEAMTSRAEHLGYEVSLNILSDGTKSTLGMLTRNAAPNSFRTVASVSFDTARAIQVAANLAKRG